MAIYHLSVKTVSRSTGRSAVAAAAYRAGERLTNQLDGAAHDYSRRRGVDLDATTLLLPDGAGDVGRRLAGRGCTAERERLWNAAEAAERRVNSTVAREYELALPAELDARGRGRLAVAFAAELVRRYGVAADVAIHAPSRDGDQRNWHAHVLTTTRAVAADGSLGAKTRVLDDRKTGPAEVEALRALWARQVNQMLSWAQAEARVDHRSHARLGLATLPGIHLGATATAMERREERACVERDGGPDVPAPATDRGRRQAEVAAANRAEVARLAQAAEAAAAAAEAAARAERERVERKRQAAAARAEAEMAAEAARRAVERPLPVPVALGIPRPVQAPQRPSEAVQAVDPERERWRAMPAAALWAAVEELRTWPAQQLAEFLPGVQAERAAEGKALMAALKAGRRAKQAEEAAQQAEREIEAIRAEPGLLAGLGVWLHDQGWRQNVALAQREAALAEERRRQARAAEDEARHQAEAKAAKDRERAAKAAGLPEIEAELRPAQARYEAVLAVWREREAAQHAEHLARLCEEANANQRRAWAREAEKTRQEAEERERRAEAARNVARADVPEQDQNLEHDDDWESLADDGMRGSEP